MSSKKNAFTFSALINSLEENQFSPKKKGIIFSDSLQTPLMYINIFHSIQFNIKLVSRDSIFPSLKKNCHFVKKVNFKLSMIEIRVYHMKKGGNS